MSALPQPVIRHSNLEPRTPNERKNRNCLQFCYSRIFFFRTYIFPAQVKNFHFCDIQQPLSSLNFSKHLKMLAPFGQMLKKTSLKSSVLYISVFQDRPQRGAFNMFENMFEKSFKIKVRLQCVMEALAYHHWCLVTIIVEEDQIRQYRQMQARDFKTRQFQHPPTFDHLTSQS